MDSTIKMLILLLAGLAVVVGLFSILVLGLWFQPVPSPVPSAPISAPPDTPPTPPANDSSAPHNSSADASAAHLQAQWALLTNDRVQQACLSQAKKTAQAQGYNPGVVWSCDCTATESSQTKSYQCRVSALDGQHPVSIACALSSRSCQIRSEQGVATYTFDELASMADS